MQFLFLPLMAVIAFGLLILGYRFFHKDVLFVFAIGCVIASNIYNIGSFGIQVGNLLFGLDSVLYTMFTFCILLAYIKFGKKSAMTITYTSMASIMLTAIIDVMAKWASSGVLGENIIWGFGSYMASILGTYVAVVLMILAIEKLQNNYVKIIIGIIVGSLVNSFIYFGATSLYTLSLGSNFLPMLIGSYIGKFMTILFALFSYYCISKFKKKLPEINE